MYIALRRFAPKRVQSQRTCSQCPVHPAPSKLIALLQLGERTPNVLHCLDAWALPLRRHRCRHFCTEVERQTRIERAASTSITPVRSTDSCVVAAPFSSVRTPSSCTFESETAMHAKRLPVPRTQQAQSQTSRPSPSRSAHKTRGVRVTAAPKIRHRVRRETRRRCKSHAGVKAARPKHAHRR